jgi:hypothetical protein
MGDLAHAASWAAASVLSDDGAEGRSSITVLRIMTS